MKRSAVCFLLGVILTLCIVLVGLLLRPDASWLLPEGKAEFELAEKAYLQARLELYNSVQSLILVGAGLFIALFSVVAAGAYYFSVAHLTRLNERMLDDRLRIFRATTMSFVYNEIAYEAFSMYEPTLQRVLRGEDVTGPEIETALGIVGSSLNMCDDGLVEIRRLGAAERTVFLSSPRAGRAELHLLNNRIYGRAAQIILKHRLQGGKVHSPGAVLGMDAECADLMVAAISEEARMLNYHWLGAYETIAFFRIHVGRIQNMPALEEAGHRMIEELLSGLVPAHGLEPPSAGWAEALRQEYENNGVKLSPSA